MYIDEQVKGRIIFTDETEYLFTSDNIIDNDISILQQATADNSFSLGGVYSSTLNMTIRISDKDTNSFNIIGSKIILYSKYGIEQDFVLRGVFWVTSADKYKDIYTLSGSDALIWFDNAIYDDTNQKGLASVLYNQFVSARYTLKQCLNIICNMVNDNLAGRNVGLITANMSNFVWNDTPPYYSGYDCGYYCVTPECANALETTSARDYLSYIAQLGAGFIECKYDENETPLITITGFEDNWNSVTNLNYKNCEQDTIERADFHVKCMRGYVEVYSGATGSWKTQKAIDYQSNCYYTLDLTGNPFVDGNWAYTRRASDGDHNCMALLESLCNILGDSYTFDKWDGNGIRDYSIQVVPFKLTYHSEERFHLGQSVQVPNSNGNEYKKSVITKIQWNFRGGYNLECSGSDNRTLFDSARRTPSTRAKEQAIAKANYLANELGAKLQEQQDELDRQWNTFSTDINNLMNSISNVSGSTDSLGDAINSLWNSMYAENDTVDSLRKRIEALEGKVNATS